MEEEKKKFLLSRIKREQLLIISSFQNYKKVFHAREISLEKTESFLQHISNTMQINNSLASNLYQYLDKAQMEAIFMRINTIFSDLIDKYRMIMNQLTFAQSKRNVKEIREICDVCHDKIETNRIENIRRGLDQDSECRAAIIKKLIEDSELERTTPVFSEDEDKQFKKQLEKVFKNKELVLQTNIRQSNVFLQTVEQEIAEFMVSFRRDFAEWGGHQIEEQNQNWGKLMKSYINKKLTNSFNNKIPNWIKKMHELFVGNQPIKPKIYFMNKECQVNQTTEIQAKLTSQMEDLNNTLIMKREALKQKERELDHEKIRSKALKNQIQSLQKYYIDKLCENSKDQNAKEKVAQLEEILANDSLRASTVNLRQSNEGSKVELRQREVQTKSRSKKKFAKLKYQMMLKKNQKEIKQLRSSESIQLSQNHLSNPGENQLEKAQNRLSLLRKQSSPLFSPYEGGKHYAEQGGGMKLKKKAYNRQKREVMPNDNDKEKITQSLPSFEEQQRVKSELKDDINSISDELKLKKKSRSIKNNNALNTISASEDSPHKETNQVVRKSYSPHEQKHQEIKSSISPHKKAYEEAKSLHSPHKQQQQEADNPSTSVLPSINASHIPVLSQDIKKRGIHYTEPSVSKERDITEIGEVINTLIQVSKCQQLVSQHDKKKLQKIIQKFFDNLQRKNSKSICFQPVQISKVVFSGNKQNMILVQSIKQHQEYASLNKQLKKQHRKHFESSGRRNKSLHSDIPKLPAIAIKNYNPHEMEQIYKDKCNISLFIDEATAQLFEQSFDKGQQKKLAKPTPAQFKGIQKIHSQLELLKRRNSAIYLQICSFLRSPFTTTRQKSPQVISMANSFSFPAFCNYFMKILWLHRECSIEDGKSFCSHIHKFQRKIISYPTDNKTVIIRRSQHLE